MADNVPDEALLVEVGLTEREYTAVLKRMEANTLSSAKRNEAAFKRTNRSVTRGFKEVDRSAGAAASGGLRNFSMQLSQVAQQGSVTGGGLVDYLRALAVQAPDLALGFGALGIAAGAVVPILFGVASGASAANEELDDLDVQGAYKSATGAIDAARKAQDRYTAAIRLSKVAQSEVTPEILGSLKLEAQAREALAALEIERLSRQKKALEDSVSDQRQQLDDLVSDAMTRTERIAELQAEALGQPAGDPGSEAAYTALEREKLRIVQLVLSENEELASSLREQQAELDLVNALIAQGHGEAAELVDQLIKAATAASDTSDAAGGIGDSLESGVSSAMRLAEALGISLKTAQALARLGPQGLGENGDPGVGRGRGGDPRESGGSLYDWRNREGVVFLENYEPPKLSKGKGGSGGKSEAEREAEKEMNRLLSERDRILRSLETPMQVYERKLADLNKLQEMGKLNSEEYTAALEGIEAERIQAEYGAVIDGIESISDAMADAIVQGESMADALRSVFQRIAADILSAGIQEALLQVFDLSGASDSSGGLLSAVGNAISGVFGGEGKAAGGVVRAGRAYEVGENGREQFFPEVNGRILSTQQAQQALRQPSAAPGGGQVDVRVTVDNNGKLQAFVERVSGATAAQVSGAGLQAQRTTLGGRSQSFNDRGTL